MDKCTLCKGFHVAIYSSRSHQWGGRSVVKKWLRDDAHVELLRIVEHNIE